MPEQSDVSSRGNVALAGPSVQPVGVAGRRHTNLIEIIGPPGAGKSTTYQELIKTWNPRSPWTFEQDQWPRTNSFLTSSKQWLEQRLRRILGKVRKEGVDIRAGLAFIDCHPDLADFLWSHLSDQRTYSPAEQAKRFRSAYFLFKDFCRLQSIIAKGSQKPFIIDEGLLQKSFLLNRDRQFMKQAIDGYTDLLPNPRAIVYIYSSTGVLFERIRTRSKIIASHIGMTDEELYEDLESWQLLFDITVRKMKERNVEVFRINGQDDLEKNTGLLASYLNKIRP